MNIFSFENLEAILHFSRVKHDFDLRPRLTFAYRSELIVQWALLIFMNFVRGNIVRIYDLFFELRLYILIVVTKQLNIKNVGLYNQFIKITVYKNDMITLCSIYSY